MYVNVPAWPLVDGALLESVSMRLSLHSFRAVQRPRQNSILLLEPVCIGVCLRSGRAGIDGAMEGFVTS